MTEAREMGRLYMKAADAAVTSIADHNRKSMHLSGASAFRSFEYWPGLQARKPAWKRSRFQVRIIEISWTR